MTRVEKINSYREKNWRNDAEVYWFVNGRIAECWHYQLDTVLSELSEEELDRIVNHFDL